MVGDETGQKDLTRSGVVTYRLCNLGQISATSISDPVFVRGFQWRIMITLRKLNNIIYMGFFLQCSGDPKNASWSCYVKASLLLKSQNPDIPSICKRITHLFHEKEPDWGFGNFKLWSEVIDPLNGFMKDGCVLLEAQIEAETPPDLENGNILNLY
ncbi:ubiquitin carboxyl-terminal hydrolase 7-like [Halyomorpha halys]|uniref:ubiquitin carboxyl-terminal hydrolase 7-like n=1 Tax=Halyomorpha halys TaxID=286706 RepID=UPI0034D16F3A